MMEVDAAFEFCVVDLTRSAGGVEAVVLAGNHLWLLFECVEKQT